ncbi:MAG: hypothetical protein AAGD88_07245 [Bacteroidota bacterium]
MELATSKFNIPLSELLIRLERNHNTIQRLSRKLNSYTCEPNNHSCFEKLYELKQGFQSFTGKQKQLVSQLKSLGKEEIAGLEAEVKRHTEMFRKLEQDMAAYLLDTNKYV